LCFVLAVAVATTTPVTTTAKMPSVATAFLESFLTLVASSWRTWDGGFERANPTLLWD
jgi:hypothetical protein